MNCSFIRIDSLTVENGTLFLPAALPCSFISGITWRPPHWCVFLPKHGGSFFIWRWTVGLHFPPRASLPCLPFYLLSGYIRCTSVFLCLLLVSVTSTIRFHKHPLTSFHPLRYRAGWNRALPLPCTAAWMHSLPQLKWEFEKPDVHLSSIPSELPPPSPPGVYFFFLCPLLSPSAASWNTQRRKDRMGMPGSSIRKFLRHYRL